MTQDERDRSWAAVRSDLMERLGADPAAFLQWVEIVGAETIAFDVEFERKRKRWWWPSDA